MRWRKTNLPHALQPSWCGSNLTSTTIAHHKKAGTSFKAIAKQAGYADNGSAEPKPLCDTESTQCTQHDTMQQGHWSAGGNDQHLMAPQSLHAGQLLKGHVTQ